MHRLIGLETTAGQTPVDGILSKSTQHNSAKTNTSMAGDDDIKKIIGRKLTKKRREPARHSVDVPDKFKDGDDAHEDVAAPKGANAQYMNQSVFSMIAAAGSKVDFNARFDDESSDSEEDDAQSEERHSEAEAAQSSKDGQEVIATKSGLGKHRRKISEHKLLKSLPKLNLRTIKERKYMSQSARASTSPESMSPRSGATPREAPVMSQMLQAQAQLKSPEALDILQEKDSAFKDNKDAKTDSALSKRLMEIFEFEHPERVISGKGRSLIASNVMLIRYRVSLLAVEKRTVTGLYVHYKPSYMLLCVSAQEIGESSRVRVSYP